METLNYQKVEQIIRVLQLKDETGEVTISGMRISSPTIPKDQRKLLIDELVRLLTTE